MKEHIAYNHTEKPLQLELAEDVQSVLKESDPFVDQTGTKRKRKQQHQRKAAAAAVNAEVNEKLLEFSDVIMFDEKPETIVTVCTDSLDILNGNIVLF